MSLKNFDQIVERAKQSFRKQRVVIARCGFRKHPAGRL